MADLLSRGDIESQTSSAESSSYDWFLKLWPLAVLFHLAANDWFLLNIGIPGLRGIVGIFQLAMLVSAVAMLLRPSPRMAIAVAVSHFLVVAAKLPIVGNHELLLLLVHIAVVLAVATKGRDWLPAVVPPLRWVLLIAYSAIAFSKLNAGFVDRSVSCAVIFGDEFGEWLHLSISNSPVLSYLAIYGTIVIELAIPALLMTRRLRRVGVGVALLFHTFVALEPVGHVFDFTSVLFMLFLLFLSPADSRKVGNEINKAFANLGSRNIVAVVLLMVAGTYTMSLVRNDIGSNWFFDYPIWLLYAGFLLRTVFNVITQKNPPGNGTLHNSTAGISTAENSSTASPKLTFAMGPMMAVIVLLTALNAASPYLELRTAAAFNMYSNLSTLNGETNHFLLPATFPIGDGVTLYNFTRDADSLSSLDFYDGDPSLSIPEENLVNFVRNFPSEANSIVEIAQGPGAGEQVTLGELADGYRPTGNLFDRFFYIRAVNPEGPTGCRRLWGPAH